MKVFRYPKGHVRYRTMTVRELVEKLSEYPDDMAVLATWEGISTPFDPQCFEVSKVEWCHPDDADQCLFIDVDIM